MGERVLPRWTRRSAGHGDLKIDSGSRETRQGRQAGVNEGEKSPADFRGQGYGASGCLMFLSREREREKAHGEDFRFRKLRATYRQTFFSSCSSTKRRLGPVVLDFRTVAPGGNLTASDVKRGG